MGSNEQFLKLVGTVKNKLRWKNPIRTKTCQGCGAQDYKDIEHLIYKCNFCGRLVDDNLSIQQSKSNLIPGAIREESIEESICNSLGLNHKHINKYATKYKIWPEGMPIAYDKT